MLKSRCIYLEPEFDDGIRISIMSRHTLDDGVTPDENIKSMLFNQHLPELGPTGKLIGKLYKNQISFDDYKKLYIDKLSTKLDLIKEIINQSLYGNVTVLCKERSPEFCHRKIFVEFVEKIAKDIGITLQIKIE